MPCSKSPSLALLLPLSVGLLLSVPHSSSSDTVNLSLSLSRRLTVDFSPSREQVCDAIAVQANYLPQEQQSLITSAVRFAGELPKPQTQTPNPNPQTPNINPQTPDPNPQSLNPTPPDPKPHTPTPKPHPPKYTRLYGIAGTPPGPMVLPTVGSTGCLLPACSQNASELRCVGRRMTPGRRGGGAILQRGLLVVRF